MPSPFAGGDHGSGVRERSALTDLAAAVRAWRVEPGEHAAGTIGAAIGALAIARGVEAGWLRLSAAPLPDLDIALGTGVAGAEIVLRAPGDDRPLGAVRLAGSEAATHAMARELELVLTTARAEARADRAARQLDALDAAVRGIGGVLELDVVLQLITDRVRDLVGAMYAALGIVNDDGTIDRFITSGIDAEHRARIGALPRGYGLLGLIIRENHPIRVADIATHPERHGFPPEHPEMHSFLGMPIAAGGEPVGRLYLTNKLGASEFSAEDQALVEMFALHAGIAIENARLHDQVRRLAVVDERDRISRDLHDSVIQAIYAQTLSLDDVPELVAEDPDEARRRVDEAVDALHAVIRDIRNFIFGLRPVLLDAGGLAHGIDQLAGELRRSSGVDVAWEGDAAPEDLPLGVVAELLAVVREALSNVARHASATHVVIGLRATDDVLRLEIADDGRGLPLDGIPGAAHHGLANMRARVEGLGGRFDLDARTSAGTRVIIELPYRS